MNILKDDKKVMSSEFIDALNNSDSMERLELTKRFLAACAIQEVKPLTIVDNTFCGEYHRAFTLMINFALGLTK